jgi:hypothetical protein
MGVMPVRRAAMEAAWDAYLAFEDLDEASVATLACDASGCGREEAVAAVTRAKALVGTLASDMRLSTAAGSAPLLEGMVGAAARAAIRKKGVRAGRLDPDALLAAAWRRGKAA